MPRPQAKKMHKALTEIANGKTREKSITKLHGEDGYRLRRGGYRAIYLATKNSIKVLRIKPRGDAYK